MFLSFDKTLKSISLALVILTGVLDTTSSYALSPDDEQGERGPKRSAQTAGIVADIPPSVRQGYDHQKEEESRYSQSIQQAKEEARKEARKEGRAEGRAEGREEGQLRAWLTVLDDGDWDEAKFFERARISSGEARRRVGLSVNKE